MFLKRNLSLVCTSLICLTLFTSCAPNISPSTYTGRDIGRVARTYAGVVRNARLVIINSDQLEQNGTGIIVGGVGGAIAANSITKGRGSGLATFGGAILGSVAGALVERDLKEQNGMEYIIELEDGTLMTIVQGCEPLIYPGQGVYVMMYDYGNSRVIPRY